MQNTQNIFKLLKECLKSSITYDIKDQSVKLNELSLNNKIDTVLKTIGCPDTKKNDTKHHIELACKKISTGITFNAEGNSTALSKAIDTMQSSADCNYISILRFGYLQRLIFVRMIGLKEISSIEGKFTTDIKNITEMIYIKLQEKEPGDIFDCFKSLRDIKAKLDNAMQEIKIPDWFYEIATQKNINQTLENNAFYWIDKIDAQVNKFIDMSNVDENAKNSIQTSTNYKNDVIAVQEAMQANNALLSKIQSYIGGEKDSLKKTHDYLMKFYSAASEGMILKALQDNNKVLGTKLKELSSVVQSKQLKDLDTVEKIDLYLKSVEDMYPASEIDKAIAKIVDIETKLSFETETGRQIKALAENLAVFKNELIRHQDYINQNTSTIIPIAIDNIHWERSGWESFNAFGASISKFFIGQNLHWQIFGHANGVEELRRAVEGSCYNDETFPCIDFEQFKIDIINETF